MIIHICGTSGSGKSFIGELFRKSMTVVDTDDWIVEFMKKNRNRTVTGFQKFIEHKVRSLNTDKINLLVGYLDHLSVRYPLTESTYKFFIKSTARKVFQQFNLRTLKWTCTNLLKVTKTLKKNYNLPPAYKSIQKVEYTLQKDLEEYVHKGGYILKTQGQIIHILDKILYHCKI